MSVPADSAPMPPIEVIPYAIAGCSEHSGDYTAENIKVDRPQDQASRWSGAQQPPSMGQWILLRLDTLAVVKSITFGKFHRKHPCNMKEFKLCVGLHPGHMIPVLHTALKDDVVPETFSIPQTNKTGVAFPTRFIKILPLSAHGQSFHISIWHVSVAGIIEPSYVEHLRAEYDEHREAVVLRHVLKHLRERRLLTPYSSVLARTCFKLEHPLVSALHTAFVIQGNFPAAEALLPQMSDVGLFDDYLRSCQPHARWVRLHATDADGDAPGPRGGHALTLDTARGIVYLFGGWDGCKSLDDLWAYDIGTEKWRMLSRSTAGENNGPGPRSCHKMVCDSKSGCLYVLGKLGDDVGRMTDGGRGQGQGGDGGASCSEFYRYHTRGLDVGKWDLLISDTASSGGPQLIFDHQMVMDSGAQTIYVFGGRVVNGDAHSSKYSGLYSYNVRTGRWKFLQPVAALGTSSVQPVIPPRYGHSMVLDSVTQTLFIFAGQRDGRYLSDMYAYDIQSNSVTELFANFSTANGPDACFTQRAVIDPKLKEIYVFCGLTRSQQTGALTVLRGDAPNWVYRYTHSNVPGAWTKILPEPGREGFGASTSSLFSSAGEGKERTEEVIDTDSDVPRPRYAHQVVYDEKTGRIFLHGGNAGEAMDDPIARSSSAAGNERASSTSRGRWREEVGSSREPEGTGASEDMVRNGHSSARVLRRWVGDRTGGMDSERDTERERDRDRNRDRGDEKDNDQDMRLDDFWTMTLIRAGPEMVRRQGIYHLRQQRFREMCTDRPALVALRYLQTEVSNVVDHTNHEEADAFRSLLSHLLGGAPLTLPAHPTTSTSTDHGRVTSSSVRGRGTNESPPSAPMSCPQTCRGSGELEHEGEWGQGKSEIGSDVPPKKRTRSSTPVDKRGTSTVAGECEGDGNGSRTGVESYQAGPSSNSSVSTSQAGSTSMSALVDAVPPEIATRSGAQKRSHAVLLLDEDPIEESFRVAGGGGENTKPTPLSADRFRQRTEVFECLLKFVEAGAKEPEGSLLDLVDAEDGL